MGRPQYTIVDDVTRIVTRISSNSDRTTMAFVVRFRRPRSLPFSLLLFLIVTIVLSIVVSTNCDVRRSSFLNSIFHQTTFDHVHLQRSSRISDDDDIRHAYSLYDDVDMFVAIYLSNNDYSSLHSNNLSLPSPFSSPLGQHGSTVSAAGQYGNCRSVYVE